MEPVEILFLVIVIWYLRNSYLKNKNPYGKNYKPWFKKK